MHSHVFFDLVNDVLEKVGRRPLRPRSPQVKIISVEPDDQVLQILAGPGSGKTEMLTWRILFELFVVGAPAERLLVTTFTRKAATELEVRLVERCDLLLTEAREHGIRVADPHVHDVRIGTLHSLCDQLLREFDQRYLEAGTRLLDEHEAIVRMARSYRFELGYETRSNQPPKVVNHLVDAEPLVALFRAPWDPPQWPSSNMDRVRYLRDLLAQHTETWVPRCAASSQLNGIESSQTLPGITEHLKKLHEKWNAYLDGSRVAALDFTTVQERFWERQGEVLGQLDHVFVDEFQDTNPIQFAIHTRWLEHGDTRLTVVGDDDQSIYRFRGSDIGCFQDLETECRKNDISFRLERLEENWRSTQNIVKFSEEFRAQSVLSAVSMPKTIRPAEPASFGKPVRLLTGNWRALCDVVAAEIKAENDQLPEATDGYTSLDAAILLFSTSEASRMRETSAAFDLRTTLEARGLRVFNPRNKMAGSAGSPVHDLLALISYLIDPVRKKRVNGRLVEVYATHKEAARWPHAESQPPKYRIAEHHASFQKKFRKSEGGKLDQPSPAHVDLLEYVDQIRAELVANSGRVRMTLASFIARLLTFRRFRHSGYTVNLFRQALFTSLLEANIAPTRLTMGNLDSPMAPTSGSNGQIEWPKQYWDLLNHFGSLMNSTKLDDEEVEAFSDGSIGMLTFHQAKGLEFDHVYVGSTGRSVSVHNALRTALFSGNSIPYDLIDGQPETQDTRTLQLATADREREVYVALTRAKKTLTILHDPSHPHIGDLNPAIEKIFAAAPGDSHPLDVDVLVRTYPAE